MRSDRVLRRLDEAGREIESKLSSDRRIAGTELELRGGGKVRARLEARCLR